MSDSHVTIEIDGKKFQVRSGAMVIEAADELGIKIPRFCYHKKLSIAANCRTLERAREMAETIIATAARTDMKVHALITDMNQVLGTTAGNALEIAEVVEYLRNDHREARLDSVTLNLCAEMLIVSGLETDRDKALTRCDEAVTSGRAAEIFSVMCAELGGPSDFIDKADLYLAKAPVVRPVYSSGILTKIDVRAVGNAIIELGGGRRAVGEPLDLSVGLSQVAPIGTLLDAEKPLALIHAASEDDAAQAEQSLLAACETGPNAPPEAPTIIEILTGNR